MIVSTWEDKKFISFNFTPETVRQDKMQLSMVQADTNTARYKITWRALNAAAKKYTNNST